MRKQRDNTRRIGGLMLDALMLSFIISFSLADVRIVDVYANSTCELSATNQDLILIRELDAVCSAFLKVLPQAQPAQIHSLNSILKAPLLAESGFAAVAGPHHLYDGNYTSTNINAP